MIWILDRLWVLENLVWGVSIFLIIFVMGSSILSAIRFSRSVGDRMWLSVGPIVTAVISAVTILAVLSNIEVYAAVIQKLAQFTGALDALAHVHAAIFISLVTVTAARGFYVVGEMDKGRYFGNDEVPRVVALAGRRRHVETFFRLIIIGLLAAFAATFLSVAWPSEASQLQQTGNPTFIGPYVAECDRSEAAAAELGFAVSSQNCVLDRLSQLPEKELRELATQVTEPTRLILALTYVSMILWTIILRWIAISRVSESSLFKASFTRQIYTAVFSLASLVLMMMWFYVAAAEVSPFYSISSASGFTGAVLSMFSIFGIVCALVAYYYLLSRFGNDFRTTKSDAKNAWLRFKGEVDGNRSA